MKSDFPAAEALAEATNELPGIERRKMFGYPAKPKGQKRRTQGPGYLT